MRPTRRKRDRTFAPQKPETTQDLEIAKFYVDHLSELNRRQVKSGLISMGWGGGYGHIYTQPTNAVTTETYPCILFEFFFRTWIARAQFTNLRGVGRMSTWFLRRLPLLPYMNPHPRQWRVQVQDICPEAPPPGLVFDNNQLI